MKQTLRSAFPAVWLLAVSSLLLAACEEQQEAQEVTRPVWAMKVQDVQGFSEDYFPGRASATQEINLAFRIPGQLIARPIDVGSEISEGELIAALDPATYQAQADRAEAELTSRMAARERAEIELDRQLTLFESGWVTKVRVDTVRAVAQTARAAVEAAEAALERAKLDLSYATLTAPFDGVVVETFVENFQEVQAKQPIARLVDPSKIEFTIFVPENLISLAPYVETISVSFDALPDVQLAGEIIEIGREASQATRTYPVTLLIDQPQDAQVLPGMAGQAYITAKLPEGSDDTGVEVPATAVFSAGDADKSYIWIIDEGSMTLSRREVQLGSLTEFGVLVNAGLAPGEWIVLKGVNSLNEGQEVRILETAERSS